MAPADFAYDDDGNLVPTVQPEVYDEVADDHPDLCRALMMTVTHRLLESTRRRTVDASFKAWMTLFYLMDKKPLGEIADRLEMTHERARQLALELEQELKIPLL